MDKRDKEKAREGNSIRARLLRAKDNTLRFSQSAVDSTVRRELVPLFVKYADIIASLDDNSDESTYDEGLRLLEEIQNKAVELGIPTE